MHFDTFGEFVRYIKESRNFSASKFAEITGNKSKTSILRIMENNCSQKTIVKFAKVLDSELNLTEEEKDEMNRILKYDNISTPHFRAMENLKFLYTAESVPETKRMKCVSVNSKKPDKSIAFADVFDICRSRKTTIIVENVLSIELVKSLHTVISDSDRNNNPEIVHLFCDEDNIESKSIMVMCLLKLATYQYYTPYICKKEMLLPKRIMIISSEKGEYAARFVSFTEDNGFYYTDTELSENFYNYLMQNVGEQKKGAELISMKGSSGEHLIETLVNMSNTDKKPSYQVEPGPCYMMIPLDVQNRLYEETGWLGLGKNHPMIKQLYSIIEERIIFKENNFVPRKIVWTSEGVRKFIETGKAKDHFAPVGALTREECIETLKSALDKADYTIKLLSEDYRLNDTEFHIFDEKQLIIADSFRGWWEDFSTIVINDRRIVRLVSDFFSNELWEKYCYNESDSRDIITGILKEYK